MKAQLEKETFELLFPLVGRPSLSPFIQTCCPARHSKKEIKKKKRRI